MDPNFKHELNGLLSRYNVKLQIIIDTGEYHEFVDITFVDEQDNEIDIKHIIDEKHWLKDIYVY